MADALSNEPGRPPARLHHAHLMASDMPTTIEFWRQNFGATVVADESMAGSRNVFLDIGGGRLNLYDNAPNHRGPVNHLGVHVVDLAVTVERLRAAGWQPRPIKVDGPLSYSMVEGPDELLIEVFHFDEATTADHLRPYFDLSPLPDASAPAAPVARGGAAQDAALSAPARARLARPPAEPLRPPPAEDFEAVARWRSAVHASWLEGDPTPEECGHHTTTIAGVRCLRSGPSDPTAPLVVYLHGGGYALGSPEVAVPITERLAAHVEVLSLDYRLAPEAPHPAAMEDTLAVIEALIAGPEANRPLILGGDSAGANLALSAALALTRRSGVDTDPAARLVGLILLSPHLDHRPRDRSGGEDPRHDVDDEAAAWLSAAYRGDRSAEDPAVSPLLADRDELGSLPPAFIQVGTLDSAFDDAVRFARAARAAGCRTTLDVWEGLWHTWHYHRDLPEADEALREAAQFATALGR